MVFRSMVSFLLCAALVSPALAGPKPQLTMEETAVRADGVTRGGEVVWLSIAREPGERFVRLIRRARTDRDDDADGVVRYELENGVPPVSLWALADVESGEVVFGAPEGMPMRPRPFPLAHLRAGPGGKLRPGDTRSYMELVIVRPAVAAWVASLGDGADTDADGVQDGFLSPTDRSMRQVAGAALPFEGLQRGDVVIVVDPDQLEHYSGKIAN